MSLPEICRTIKSYRYDCGCLYYDCTPGTGTGTSSDVSKQINSCLVGNYFLNNSKLDFNLDQIETNADIVLSENIGVCSAVFNLDIQNFFCMLQTTNCVIPANGHFRFKDSYGIIYTTDWEYFDNVLDVTWTTYDPRITGEEDAGFMIGHQVFRRGIITTTRQVSEIVGSGADAVVTIISEETEQIVDYFRVTFDCGDERPTDPFAWHYDCATSDDLEIESTSISSSGS